MKLTSDTQKGITFILLSALCFAFMSLFIRLAGDLPTVQKSFFRNLVAFLIAAAGMKRTGVPFRTEKSNLKYLLARSIGGCVGILGNFYAVDHMALSDATILNKLSPFFAMIFSIWVVGEVANRYDWAAIIAAFIGMLFVAKPSFSMEAFPALAGIAGGLGAGIAYSFVRKLSSRGVNSLLIVAFFSGFTMLVLTPSMLLHYVPMSAKQWLFLLLTGISAAGGQFTITKAYSYAPAREISVYDYSIVLFSALLGFIFLGQLPDALSIVGYVIIIGAAVWKWYYTGHKAAAEKG